MNLFANSIVAMDMQTGAVQVALPVHPPRHLGHGQRDGAGAGRRPHPRPDAQARRLRQQDRHVLHPRPHRRLRPAGHRRDAGARRTRARRPGPPSRSRARAPGPRPSSTSRSARGPGRPEPRGAQLRPGLRCTTPHWDVPILSFPGHGGGADWNHQSFSHSTKLVYTGFGYVARGPLADRGEQRPAAAGRVPDRRHRRGRPVDQPGAGRSRCRTRWRTATAS